MDSSMTEKMNILDDIKKNLQENMRRKAESLDEEHRIKSQPNDMGDPAASSKFYDRRKQFNKLVITNEGLDDLVLGKNQMIKSQIPVIVEMPERIETPTPLSKRRSLIVLTRKFYC